MAVLTVVPTCLVVVVCLTLFVPLAVPLRFLLWLSLLPRVPWSLRAHSLLVSSVPVVPMVVVHVLRRWAARVLNDPISRLVVPRWVTLRLMALLLDSAFPVVAQVPAVVAALA